MANDFRMDDRVKITGTAGDGRRYVNLVGNVATASDDGSLKVWPDAYDVPAKLWFEPHNIESVELLHREQL